MIDSRVVIALKSTEYGQEPQLAREMDNRANGDFQEYGFKIKLNIFNNGRFRGVES